MTRSVPVFAAGMAIVAVVGGAAATEFPLSATSVAIAPLLLVGLVIGGVLPTSFTASGNRNSLDLFEAALTPVVLLLPGLGAVTLAAVAKLLSMLYLRRLHVEPIKVAFNVAMWACVAAVASDLYTWVGNGSMRGIDIGALAIAMALGMVVNHLAVVIVMALSDHRSVALVLEQFRPVIIPGWVIGSAVNLSFGLLFAVLAAFAPAATPLMLVPLATLFFANRSYATARADRVRLEGLQRATHELGAAVDPLDGTGAFLDIVRAHFESEEVELVLFDGARILRSGASLGSDDAGLKVAEVTAALGSTLRITAADHRDLLPLLAAKQRRNCIAVPLRQGPQVVGALVSYGREGLEGFEDGEVAVLEALAGEVVSALHRGELLATLVQERSRYHDLVARSSDGILSMTADGLVDTWNPAMVAITGFGADEVVGHTLAPLRLTDADDTPVGLDKWLEHEDLPSEVRIVTRSGEHRWLGCSYSRDRADASLVIVARDITKAKELEQLKDDFVATVSHELRTPLTTIRGFTQMLLDPSCQVTDEQRDDALAMIRKGAHRLDRLVVNLLEVSRIAACGTPTTTESMDLVAASRTVVDEQLESWPQRAIRVIADGPVYARANQVSFEQTLANLVSNALKYAPLSPIDVHVNEDHGSAIVTVTDHGPGIPRQALHRVFGRFERLDHVTSQAGTGLGLYIANQLTRAMGGELTLDSDTGQGCTFTIRLPVAPRLALVHDSLTG